MTHEPADLTGPLVFEQHYLECLSQASYLIGDRTSGRAVVVDPKRDIGDYLTSAAEQRLQIELVIETHFHADFLSGHLELAAATGAAIGYGSVAEPEFEHRKLADGERIELGAVALEIRHTPGHTPESISIVVYEHGEDAVPFGVLTGDTLFVGDVGRPDLLSSKGVSSAELAAMLYESLHTKLTTLPDATRVYPAHGAGSACGKSLSTDTWSTIGDQKRSNYALAPMAKEAFIAAVTEGQTAPPAYFSFDAVRNREVHEILDEARPVPAMEPDDVLRHQLKGAVLLDTRDPAEFALGHLAGSVNVGLAGRYAELVGGVVQPGAPIILVADPGMEIEARNRLARIGFDTVVGYLPDVVAVCLEHPEAVDRSRRVDVAELERLCAGSTDLQLVDVRQPGELAAGMIEGATSIPLTQLNQQLATLDAARETIVYCAGGYRSSIAASKMAAAGFGNVADLLGGYNAWAAAHPATAE